MPLLTFHWSLHCQNNKSLYFYHLVNIYPPSLPSSLPLSLPFFLLLVPLYMHSIDRLYDSLSTHDASSVSFVYTMLQFSHLFIDMKGKRDWERKRESNSAVQLSLSPTHVVGTFLSLSRGKQIFSFSLVFSHSYFSNKMSGFFCISLELILLFLRLKFILYNLKCVPLPPYY